MKHLLRITDLTKENIEGLLDRADDLLNNVIKKNRLLDTLNGQIIANLFFEPSTRTQYSFTVASQRLGACVLNPVMSQSSTVKGESLLDTARAFISMGARLLVVRHCEDKINQWLAEEIKNAAVIVNGGDGSHEHPSQALLDLLTIRQYKRNFKTLKVVIIGDISHSRVARSLVQGLQIMGCSDINLVAPEEFLSAEMQSWNVTTYQSINDGLENADVIVSLRIQHERMVPLISASIPKTTAELFNNYNAFYGLTKKRLEFARPDAIVMHPGPMNIGVEIDASVAYGPQSVIFQQITNGVAARMAIIESLLTV